METIDIKVVIGAQYGDEGKGLMTDYYASLNPDATIIRYNGGCQAGHTVQTPEGKSHIFSHFSSGTFNGNSTYLSRFFVVNPILFRREHEAFVKEFGFKPKVIVDNSCYVTTPYDMMINHHLEMFRYIRHGSCGVGFGETLERVKRGHIITADDSKNFIVDNIQIIRDQYFPSRCNTKQDFDFSQIESQFYEDMEYFRDHTTLSSSKILSHKDLIFEGAQGLLLDQDYNAFPHVTRSNTGMRNVSSIINDLDIIRSNIEVNYITRSYITRHGNGPLPNECTLTGFEIEDKTNVPNEWQGTLRFALLDMHDYKLMTYKDFALYAPFNAKMVKTITCMDQVVGDSINIIRNGLPITVYKSIIENEFKYCSYGPTRETIRVKE